MSNIDTRISNLKELGIEYDDTYLNKATYQKILIDYINEYNHIPTEYLYIISDCIYEELNYHKCKSERYYDDLIDSIKAEDSIDYIKTSYGWYLEEYNLDSYLYKHNLMLKEEKESFRRLLNKRKPNLFKYIYKLTGEKIYNTKDIDFEYVNYKRLLIKGFKALKNNKFNSKGFKDILKDISNDIDDRIEIYENNLRKAMIVILKYESGLCKDILDDRNWNYYLDATSNKLELFFEAESVLHAKVYNLQLYRNSRGLQYLADFNKVYDEAVEYIKKRFSDYNIYLPKERLFNNFDELYYHYLFSEYNRKDQQKLRDDYLSCKRPMATKKEKS